MKKILIIFTAFILVLTGCNTSTKTNNGEIDYTNQSDWEFVSGKMQSPINIETSNVQEMNDEGLIELNYANSVEKVVNNGHAIEGEIEGEAVINGREFKLKQFHFHAESEHTINGEHKPLEIHFVHQAQDGRIAVIGVFVEEGSKNEAFQAVLDAIDKDQALEDFNAMQLLPNDMSYFHYLGSLTTPPLSENVEWYVMQNSIQVSKEQIEQFKKYYSENNRDVQPLNDRVVLSNTK